MRGVVNVVTGGGKTVFAEMCIVHFHQTVPEGRTLIIVPTASLLDQWYVELQESLGIPPESIALFSGDEHSTEPKSINIAVINTARNIAASITSDVPTFVIADECHRFGSRMNALALQGRHRATLGLSATPERDYDDGFRNLVEPALGPVIYAYDYRSASRDHVISPFAIVNVEIDLLPDEHRAHVALTTKAAAEARRLEHSGGSDERLKRILQKRAALSSSAAMRLPVTAKLVDRHRGQRILIFHERVDAAEQLFGILRRRGHNVTVYHSRIAPVVRRDNLKLYRRGLFDVLVSCRALDEGMNVPETTIAIIASSTASRRQRVQRLGRVLRPAPGKVAATIYTLFATGQERSRLEEEEVTLEGVAGVEWVKGYQKRDG